MTIETDRGFVSSWWVWCGDGYAVLILDTMNSAKECGVCLETSLILRVLLLAWPNKHSCFYKAQWQMLHHHLPIHSPQLKEQRCWMNALFSGSVGRPTEFVVVFYWSLSQLKHQVLKGIILSKRKIPTNSWSTSWNAIPDSQVKETIVCPSMVSLGWRVYLGKQTSGLSFVCSQWRSGFAQRYSDAIV